MNYYKLLILFIMEIEKLWEIFRKKQLSLTVDQRQTLTKEEFNKILNWDYLSYEDTLEGWKINTWYNISYKEMLNLLEITQENLEGKTIVDIWWGFSFLPFFMDWKKSDIKIVDPIFNQHIRNYIYSNIEAINKKIAILNKVITKKEGEISALRLKEADLDVTNIQERWIYSHFEWEILKLSNILEDAKKGIKSWYKIITELEYWKELSDIEINNLLSEKWWKLWNTQVQLLVSWWENISWIDEDSVDVIIINHVITKATVNPNTLLSTVSRLLKKGGKIYITENGIIDFENLEGDYEGIKIEVKYIKWPQDIIF